VRRSIAQGIAVVMTIASSLVVAVPAAHALSPVVGWLDNAFWDDYGKLHVQGWALTADYPGAALGVRVTANGVPLVPDYALANTYRLDVGNAYPGYGNFHGFDFVTAAALLGTLQLCVQGQNAGVYSNLAGCRAWDFTQGESGAQHDLLLTELESSTVQRSHAAHWVRLVCKLLGCSTAINHERHGQLGRWLLS
jgi:hypothetical protein